jgi:hypothetical protein
LGYADRITATEEENPSLEAASNVRRSSGASGMFRMFTGEFGSEMHCMAQ